MGNQNGIDSIETPSEEKRLLPRRANANAPAFSWDTGLQRSRPCFPWTAEDSWMGSWMARLGLSKLEPIQMKPTHS